MSYKFTSIHKLASHTFLLFLLALNIPVMAEKAEVQDDDEQKSLSGEKKPVSSDTVKNIIIPVTVGIITIGLSRYLFSDTTKPPEDDIVSPKVSADWQKLKPVAIKEYLDQYIIGQDEAKVDASIAIYTQLKKTASDNKSLPPTSLLFVGPTGSGKTTLANYASRVTNMPTVSVNATSLTQTGYVGQDIEDIIGREVFRQCKQDIALKKDPAMIVIIDEFDKLRMQPRNDGPDIGGESVQNQLLQFEQGATIQYSPKNYRGKAMKFSTKNMMFIYLGAFSNLQKKLQEPNPHPQPNHHIDISHKHIREYGFKKELVARMPNISQLTAPTAQTLVRTLEEPKDSIIQKYKNWFTMEGIQLSFTQEAKEYIAEIATSLDLGARGLNTIIGTVLKDYMYEIPSQQNKQNITIEKADVESQYPSGNN